MTIQQHEELLKKVKDLQEENTRLKKRKKYGLIWEDKPEIFDEQSKNALPVLVEKDGHFNDTISDPDGDFNILIEGDNYHSLSVLKYTHRNSIDLIYADPPYNTGSTDWKYNNNYVDKEDAFRHSRWLSFMNKRLKIAKDLLKNNGILCIAIDHYELYTLGLLLDNIFGEENRIGIVSVVHKSEGRNQEKFFGTSNEFMLVYAKDKSLADFEKVVLDEEIKKTFNLEDELGLYRLNNYIRSGGGDDNLKVNKPHFFYSIYISKDLKQISLEYRKDYEEILPITNTGQERTWKTKKETFLDRLDDNKIIALKDQNGKTQIFEKYRENQVIKTHWINPKYHAIHYGTKIVEKILGGKKFNFPKSLHLIEDIIKLTSNRSATILDFFSGSGTTGHAVLELNKEDGGNRKFILCTNNENKICEEVTYERIKRVSQGYKNKKGEKVEGLGGNLKYLKTDFIQIDNSIDDLKEKIVEASTQILCLKESTFKEKDIQEKIKIFESSNQYTAILFDTFYLKEFTEVLNKLIDKKVSVYVFAYDKNFSKEEFHNLSQAVEYTVEPIPEKLLETYQEIFNF